LNPFYRYKKPELWHGPCSLFVFAVMRHSFCPEACSDVLLSPAGVATTVKAFLVLFLFSPVRHRIACTGLKSFIQHLLLLITWWVYNVMLS
jgi:hypothetical protein